MSWFFKSALVLGILAVHATAETAQMKDVGELAMTEEEEEFFTKMATVILKAQALNGWELAALEELYSHEKRAPTGSGDCTVTGNVANCCGDFSISPFNLNGCVRGEYLPKNKGVHLTVTFNGNELINGEVSAANPIPLCVGIPGVRLASVCVKMSDINFGQNEGDYSACLSVSAKFFWRTIGSFDIGCFNFD